MKTRDRQMQGDRTADQLLAKARCTFPIGHTVPVGHTSLRTRRMAELLPAQEESLESSLPIVTPKTSAGSILQSRASNLLGPHLLISDSFTVTLKNLLRFEFF